MNSRFLIFAVMLTAACAPVKKSSNSTEQSSGATNPNSNEMISPGDDAANIASESDSAISAVNLSGRHVDLYVIRAGNAQVFLPPDFDKLPCGYFKQGPEFQVPPVPGGPPISLRGPVQNFYSGKWVRETEYTFKLSVYKRIYRDPGIPDWLPNPPTTRVTEYVLKLFDVTISSPSTAGCRIFARPLN